MKDYNNEIKEVEGNLKFCKIAYLVALAIDVLYMIVVVILLFCKAVDSITNLSLIGLGIFIIATLFYAIDSINDNNALINIQKKQIEEMQKRLNSSTNNEEN